MMDRLEHGIVVILIRVDDIPTMFGGQEDREGLRWLAKCPFFLWQRQIRRCLSAALS